LLLLFNVVDCRYDDLLACIVHYYYDAALMSDRTVLLLLQLTTLAVLQ
jgi:hypothetical protein